MCMTVVLLYIVLSIFLVYKSIFWHVSFAKKGGHMLTLKIGT
jgi:hypothetical protein